MLEALTVTLREGVEAALIVGITLVYLAKIGRPDLRKPVYAALVAALLASVGVAVALSRTAYNQDLFEGWVMLAAAFFVATMIVFMMRTARRLKGDIETKVETLAGRSSRLGLFAFIFLMVLREGVETVLILSAVSLNSTQLMNFLGTLLGVGLAVVFGVTFVKGSVRINLQKFFRVTTVILLFVVAQLVVSGVHELGENGILPSSRREMAVIGPIVRNDLFFFVTILALAGLMILFEGRRRAPLPESGSPAARRKAAWSARRERLWMAAVYVSSFLFIVMVTAQFVYTRSVSALSPATQVEFHDGRIVIPLSQLADGDLHRYVAEIQGVPVRFLLYRKPDGKVATVYDACEICGAVGFYKSSTGMICKNCAAPINPMSVGQPGGCNPIPLKATITAAAVEITQSDLAAEAKYFAK
ncbi:MAG TPA: Fe-S-containing protein [Terriglobales bacterium]|nr:Fe-S-containing protein [Terriglobales bacterium]